ncbi:MAG: sugar phosphate nucleotidyltransferase [Candidatus Helarchaeota archaeon]
MVNWTAVILAGGIGSRLQPLTSDRPKPLVPVVGKPMIIYAIDLLRYAGVSNIIIVVKHMGDKIREFIKQQNFGVSIQIPDVNSLDTADALRKVSDLIETDHIVVSMADIITNIHLKEFLEFSLSKDGIGAISLVSTDMPSQFGVIVLSENHRINSFLEKPEAFELYLSSRISSQNYHLHRNVINTGIYAFSHEILDILNRTSLMDFGKDVFPYLLENNYALYGYIAKYYWQDAGTPKYYKYVNWDLLRKWAWPIVPPGTELREYIWIGENCQIPNLDNLQQHVSIGNNIQLGENVVIESLSALGNNIQIAENVKIKESVIWDNVKIGKNCSITNSILCENVILGENVVIEPDVIIASNSKIGHDVKITSGKIIPPSSRIKS